MSFEQLAALVVLAAVVGALIWGRLRSDVVALAGAAALLALGVVRPVEVQGAFASPAVIALASLFVISYAMELTGLLGLIIGSFDSYDMDPIGGVDAFYEIGQVAGLLLGHLLFVIGLLGLRAGYAGRSGSLGAGLLLLAVFGGVDGVLVVDYPPEECAGFAAVMKQAQIDPIFLLAPTSTEQRYGEVAQIGSGYIYYVSLKGVTGSGSLDLDEVAQRIPLIREKVGMPVGVGFGIRDGATAARIAAVADAVVIGSRIIEEIERAPIGEAPARVKDFLSGIRAAMDAATDKRGAIA